MPGIFILQRRAPTKTTAPHTPPVIKVLTEFSDVNVGPVINLSPLMTSL